MRTIYTIISILTLAVMPQILTAQQLGDLSGRTLILNDGGVAGGTKNTITLTTPNAATLLADYTLVWPIVAGTTNQLLRVGSVAGTTLQLDWSPTFGVSPYEEATAGQFNVRRITALITGLPAVPANSATDLQSARLIATQTASGGFAFIGGGQNNTASGSFSGILSGSTNIAGSIESFVGGGFGNSASGGAFRGAIVGGEVNNLTGSRGFIGAGNNNSNSGSRGVLVGGDQNVVAADFASNVGGSQNNVSGTYSIIGGGSLNVVSGSGSGVLVGAGNTVTADGSVIVGGTGNTISAATSFIGGGSTNGVSGIFGSVLGGENNRTSGDYSAIWGGQNLRIGANNVGGFNSGVAMTITTSNVAVFANNNVWLGNTNNTASQLRFFEPQITVGAFPAAGTNFAALRAATAMAADNIYDLPTANGSVGQILKIATVTGNDATLTWGTDLGSPVIQAVAVAGPAVIAVNANVTYIRITSSVAPAAAPVTFVPPAGYSDGTMIIVRVIGVAPANGVTFTDAAGAPNEFQLSGNFQPQNDDTITFVWDATTTTWLEVARRNN